MTCLVQGCESIEKYLIVKFTLDGEEKTGQVCSRHAHIVMDGNNNSYSIGPVRLDKDSR